MIQENSRQGPDGPCFCDLVDRVGMRKNQSGSEKKFLKKFKKGRDKIAF